jgi:hypothetical protein
LTMVHPTSGEAILLLSLPGILITYLIHFFAEETQNLPGHYEAIDTGLFISPAPFIFPTDLGRNKTRCHLTGPPDFYGHFCSVPDNG